MSRPSCHRLRLTAGEVRCFSLLRARDGFVSTECGRSSRAAENAEQPENPRRTPDARLDEHSLGLPEVSTGCPSNFQAALRRPR